MNVLDQRPGRHEAGGHYYLWLGLILFLGLAVRLWGLSFGLPNVHCRPDESTLVHKALAIGAGDLNPHFFNYPSFYLYLLTLVYGIYFVGGWLSGLFAGVKAFEHLYFTDPSVLYLIGRLCSAALGTGSVWLTFLLARRVGGMRAGLLSAFFLSLAFLHVRDSHFLTVDVPATFFMLLGCIFALRHLEGSRWGDLVGGAVFFGLAASTKYNLGLFGLTALVAAWLSPQRQVGKIPWQQLSGCALAMGLAFVAGSPFALLDFETFWRDLSYERLHFFTGHAGFDLGSGGGWWYHLSFSLPHGLGWPLLLMGLAGCAWLGWRRRPEGWALLSGLLLYCGVAGSGRGVFVRYMLPVIPLLCVAAGCFGDILFRGKGRRWAVLLAILLVIPSALAVWQHDRMLARMDTRLMAARWIEEQLPDGTRIAMVGSDFGYPQVRRSRSWMKEQLEDMRMGGLSGRGLARMLELEGIPFPPSYYVVELQAVNPLNRRTVWTTFGVDRLRQEGIEWVVTHQHPLAYSQVDPAFRKELEREALLVQRFNPFSERAGSPVYDPVDAYYVPLAGYAGVERPGPSIQIYRLSP